MYKYRLFSLDDSDAIRELIKVTFQGFLDGKYWDWKHLYNPRFDPSLVAVAEKNGEIVGCSHWLQGKFKIARNIEVNSILTCDLAVKLEHRRRGIAKKLLLQRRTRETFKQRGIVINYDFANPKLAKKLYTPLLGYIKVGLTTKKYYKMLSWRKIIEKIEKTSEHRKLEKETCGILSSSLTILCRFRGAPPLTIQINQGSIKAIEGSIEPADVVVEGDLANFASLKGEKRIKSKLLKSLLTRKIKVKGNLIGLFKLYRNFNVLEKTFRALMKRD